MTHWLEVSVALRGRTRPKDLRDELRVLVNLIVSGDASGAKDAMASHLRLWRPEESTAVEAEPSDIKYRLR